MATLKFLGRLHVVDGYDTVLQTLLKNGHAIPHGCGDGHCEDCLMKATAGDPMPFSQIGLEPELIDIGYFLACRCMIYADMEVSVPDEEELARITGD